MVYNFNELKRNEKGKEYEKGGKKLEIEDQSITQYGDNKKDFYEWELEILKTCGFCHNHRPDPTPDREDKERGGTAKVETEDDAWQDIMNGSSSDRDIVTETGDVAFSGHVTDADDVADAGNFADQNYNEGYANEQGQIPGEENNAYIPPVPYKPPVPLPTEDETPQPPPRPRVVPPMNENPVLMSRKLVTDNSKATKTLFKMPKEEEHYYAPIVPFERRKFRYLVQPEQEFEYNNPLWNNEKEKEKEKEKKNEKQKEDKDCPKKGGLYIPVRVGEDPLNSKEFSIIRQIAGKFGEQLYRVDADGWVFIPPHYPDELKQDIGFKLLHDIAYNKDARKILFSVANILDGIDRETKTPIKNVVYDRLTGKYLVDMNYSFKARNDSPRDANDQKSVAAWNKANALPIRCFDGSVAVPEDDSLFRDTKSFDEEQQRRAPLKKLLSRAFHALAENYFRTIEEMDFKDKRAHIEAANLEAALQKGDPRRSLFPGSHVVLILN